MPELKVRTNGRELVLSDTRSLLLGRDQSADLRYQDHRVSRRHAAIRFDGQRWVLEDLGSSNGTYLNGARITSQPVTGPLVLRLGDPFDGPEVELEPLATAGAVPPPAGRAIPAPPVAPPSPLVAATPPGSPWGGGPPSGPLAGAGAPAPTGPAAPAPPPAEMTAALDRAPGGAEEGADLGTTVAVHPLRSAMVRMGRAPGNEIVLADPHVSRVHAQLRWDDRQGWLVTDLGSHNGTYVNGHRVATAPLREGDVITVGRRHLRMLRGALEEHESGDVRLDAIDLSVVTPEGKALLQHVSLTVEKGAFVGVVGPSGAGKTTLLNALTGFRPADQGTVLYGGRNLYAEYEEMRRRIGYVPQDDIVHSQLTVRRALGYAAELRFPRDVANAERERRVEEVMRELALAERADLVIEKLSGGQRKRVNIGVELLTKPSPLFLDEPTSGLDPGLERGMMTLLRDLARGGRTVIVVTHAVQSLNLCDRVLVLATGGRVAFYGPPDAALSYFGKPGFVEVFEALETAPDAPWDQRFWASHEYATYVARPLAALQAPPPRAPRAPNAPQPPRDWPRQTWILLRRYVATLVSDRSTLLLLLGEAPALGLIMLLAISSGTFDPTVRRHALAQTGVTILVLVMTMTGLINAIREVVKEAPTYRRERFIGLSIPAYILSKLAVLGPLTVIQAIIVVLIGFADQSGPDRVGLIIDAILSGLAAVALGLMISAWMRSTDKAIYVLLLVLVAQLVMAMPILDLAHKAVVGQLSWLFSARWGVDAVASTVNLNALQPMGFPPAPTPEWAHGFWPWSGEILMLIGLTAAFIGAAMWLLRRQDPTLLTAPPQAVRPAAAQVQPAAAR